MGTATGKGLTILLILLSLTGAGQTEIDKYAESNSSASLSSYAGYIALYQGQSFTNTNSITLSSCKAYLTKTGSPTGSIYAYIYAHTGTYGSTGVPTGSALATSDAVDVSTLTGSQALYTFTFSGANKITLTASTYYCLVIAYNGGNSSNLINVFRDNSSSTHSGNWYYSGNASSWTAANQDMIFYVYGESGTPAASPTPFMQTQY